MSLLVVDRVCVQHTERGRTVEAVRDVSFSVERGERVGLVGPSGCGKSSLLRAVLGLEPVAAGTITFDGQPVRGAGKSLRARMAPMFQDSLGALDPRWRVAQSLAEPLRLHGRPHDARVLDELLALVKLPTEVGARYPRELSVGQGQRVNLARALALQPDLLLLDEPVSALDVSVQAQIVALLDELAKTRGLAMILVSHDLEVVAHLCPRVLRMADGRLEGP
jgi:peptide/nickel transport system ATP-binding protein